MLNTYENPTGVLIECINGYEIHKIEVIRTSYSVFKNGKQVEVFDGIEEEPGCFVDSALEAARAWCSV